MGSKGLPAISCHVVRSVASVSNLKGEGSCEYLPGDRGDAELGRDSGMDERLKWAALVRSYQPENPDIFWQ